MTRHTRRVFGIAYRFVGRVDEAEDLTQDIFVKVFQSLDRYRESDGAFGTWVGTVARNHAIDNYRRRREERSRRIEDPAVLDTVLPHKDESPLRSLERAEQARLVHRGLRALPADLREPIVLCDLQGLSYEEAAARPGDPAGNGEEPHQPWPAGAGAAPDGRDAARWRAGGEPRLACASRGRAPLR